MSKAQSSYTGYRRKLRTRLGVRASEWIARYLIWLGGLGTVIAVLGVSVFLAWVVVPLFLPGSATGRKVTAPPPIRGEVLRLDVGEYRKIASALFRDGTLEVFRLDSGEIVDQRRVVDGDELTAWSFPSRGGHVAFGFRDGTVRLGRIGFETAFLPPDSVPESVGRLAEGEVATFGKGVVERVSGKLRLRTLLVELEDPVETGSDAPVLLLDHVSRQTGPIFCALNEDGAFRLSSATKTENLFTGEVDYQVKSTELPFSVPSAAEDWPAELLVAESSTSATVIWRDGRVVRYDTRDLLAPVIAEERDILSEPGLELTAFGMLVGRTTFLAGDSGGNLTAWFPSKREAAGTPDGVELVAAHRFRGSSAVTAIASSPRSRLAAVGHADGSVRLYHVTSGARVTEVEVPQDQSLLAVSLAPKNDGVVVLTEAGIWQWDIDLRHPEATLAALFLPVWYEGYPEPAHAWQSTGGTDNFEPKFGLWPLVFGTLKATFYSLLFGVPIAILAAIFTSEFLTGSVKTKVKTLIELMASLPSVVLGFLAGLVFAPFVQNVLPATLVSFLVIPGLFLAGAYVWQLLPNHVTLRFADYRLAIIVALVPIAIGASILLGPVVEKVLFAGDIMAWLDGRRGSSFGGWVFFLIPVSACVVAWVVSRFVMPRFRARAAIWERNTTAKMDLLRFVSGAVGTVALACIVAGLFTARGWDLRGEASLVDTYVQRNALVVGVVMGFAIIPIIYTIAEDALSAVPQHLRAASLGAGATQWQTAIRIVLPTAMSGLFSAVMIGLGRAVGETMIVLMAAGNTPILEMNLFNGFRTLSANIAVELPEAVQGSTHYRTLFLAALLLFVMTFFVNTLAESVRLRFRKRAYQL